MARKAPPPSDGLVHALLYTRVSGAEHQKKGLSLEAQTKALHDYVAAQHAWVIDGEYQDILSGKRSDRPAYLRMREHARQLRAEGKQTVVVVVRLDRFGRRVLEYLRCVEEFTNRGVVIHSADSGAEVDEEWAIMKMTWAQKEGKLIGQRIAAARNTVVNKGWFYGRTPMGYRGRPPSAEELAAGARDTMQQIEPDPITAPVVVEAFDRISSGESIRSTARWIASLPAERRGNNTWRHQTLLKMLRSPSYIARACIGADNVLERPVCRWKRLVSDEQWQVVQKRLDANERGGSDGSEHYLLTGYLRCDRCGSRMSATHDRTHPQGGYRCTDRQRGAKASGFDCSRYVGMPKADEAVIDALRQPLWAAFRWLSDPSRRAEVEHRWAQLSRPTDNTGTRKAELERVIQTANTRLARAATMLTDGVLDAAGYKALRDQEVSHADTARAELNRLALTVQSVKMPPPEAWRAQLETAVAALGIMDSARQRKVLDMMVKTVTVRRDGSSYVADIEWNETWSRFVTLALTKVELPVAA